MVERSEFNGRPVIILKRAEEDKYPFTFGLNKARLILENLDEIKKFVDENNPEHCVPGGFALSPVLQGRTPMVNSGG